MKKIKGRKKREQKKKFWIIISNQFPIYAFLKVAGKIESLSCRFQTFSAKKQQGKRLQKINNIDGRLPENTRNSFVDLQSQKDSIRNRPKKKRFKMPRSYILIRNMFN